MKQHTGILRIIGALLVCLILCPLFTTFPKPASANFAIYVPDSYPTIQDAINASSAGGTIIVRDGTYSERLIINKDITLQSENGSSTTIINGNIKVSYSCTIDGFSISCGDIHNSDSVASGIIARWVANGTVTIRNNNIYNNRTGIYLQGQQCNFQILNNSVHSNNGRGIDAQSVANIIIANNIIFSNDDIGLLLSNSRNAIAENNTIYSHFGSLGMGIRLEGSGNIIRCNNINNNDVGISIVGGNNILYRNTISQNGHGMDFNNTECTNVYFLNTMKLNGGDVYLRNCPQTWNSSMQIEYVFNGSSFVSELGNYWDNYVGNDNNSDGIGETSYELNNVNDDPFWFPYQRAWDYYPLISGSDNYSVVNYYPFQPSDPSPSDNDTGVGVDMLWGLCWSGGDLDPADTVTYAVFFGTDSNPPLLADGISTPSYDPGILERNTKYYWRVNSTDNHGDSTQGPLWCFTTSSPVTNISATSAILHGYLSSLGTCENVTVSFQWRTALESYSGNSTTPQVMDSPGIFAHNLTDLHLNTSYYYRARAIMCDNTTVYGNELSFTTSNESGLGPGQIITATGTGTVTIQSDLGELISLSAISVQTLPNPPPNVIFPHGLIQCAVNNISNGSTVVLTITFPDVLPANMSYWKYQPTSGWFQIPIISQNGSVITIQITDGGLGDADGLANGVIIDPGGPAIPAPSMPVGGGGGGGDSGPLSTNLWVLGNGRYWEVTQKGVFLKDAVITSEDGSVTIFIPSQTKGLGPDGKPIFKITADPIDPPPAPEGMHILAAFDLEPNGATFSPGIQITIPFDPADVAAGETVAIAFYNEATGTWDFVEGTINVDGTASFSIDHFTVFAVLADAASTPTPTTTSAASPTHESGGISTTVWIGIAVGIILAIMIIILLFMRWRRSLSY